MNKIKLLLNNLLISTKISFKASKSLFLLKLLLALINSILPVLSLLIWRGIINNIVITFSFSKAIVCLLFIYVIIDLVKRITSQISDNISRRYNDKIIFYIEMQMMEKASLISLEYFDDFAIGEKIVRTRNNFSTITNATWELFSFISIIINLIISFIAISFYKIELFLCALVFLIPYSIYVHYNKNKSYNLELKNQRKKRISDYIINSFYDNDIRFEMKVNNIDIPFLNKYKELNLSIYNDNNKFRKNNFIFKIIIGALNILTEFLAIMITGIDLITGKILIGDFTYCISLFANLKNNTSSLVNSVNTFVIYNKRILEINEFLNLKPEREKSGNIQLYHLNKIEFKHVSFKYPNSELFILKNCSFEINQNERAAIVGINGSGKSTIIKLLLRFYDVNSGEILINDINIKEYDIYQLRRSFNVLFQDYVTYCLPIREIIALSDFKEVNNNEKIYNAAYKSSFYNIIKNWDNKFDTVLGRYYADNGKDLSGGQWQLLSLSRTYFKNSKNIILDEPSASLDVNHENQIFQTLYNSNDLNITLCITHKLSNIIASTKIIVLNNGEVIETGTHQELLKNKNLYYHLFNTQKELYK